MSYSRRSVTGWGYAIDYDKAIADDRALIALLESKTMVCISQELLPEAKADHPDFASWTPYSLVAYKADGLLHRAAKLGLTREDVRAWAYFMDETNDSVWDVLGDEQKGDYRRGQDLDTSMRDIEVYTEAERKKALAKAKVSLSRHQRNKQKWG